MAGMYAVSIRLLAFFLCVFATLRVAQGMYEDQIGSSDWYQENIGVVTTAFQPASKRVAYVATESGTIAAIRANKGSIEWRRVLPDGESVDAFLYHDDTLVTLSGVGKTISAWKAKDGAKLWQSTVYSYEEFGQESDAVFKDVQFDGVWVEDDGEGMADVITLVLDRVQSRSGKDGRQLWSWSPPKGTGQALHFLHLGADSNTDGRLSVVGLNSGGEVVVTSLSVKKGTGLKAQTLKSPTGTVSPKDDCVPVQPGGQLVCVDSTGNLLIAELGKSSQFTSVDLKALLPKSDLKGISLDRNTVTNGFVLHFGDEQSIVFKFSGALKPTPVHTFKGKREFSSSAEIQDKSFLAAVGVGEKDDVQIDLLEINSGKLETSVVKDYLVTEHGKPSRVFLGAYSKKDSNTVSTKVMIVAADHSLSQVTGSRLMWTREEALASVTHSQIVDFPAELALRERLQKEFAADPSDSLMSHFIKRVTSEFSQLVGFLSALPSTDPQAVLASFGPSKGGQDIDLQPTKDRFGFKKLIVVATAAGKLFGLHSMDGSIMWSRYLADTTPLALYVARGGAHPPPQGILVASTPSGSSAVVSLNLLTGEDLGGEKPLLIDAAVRQSFLLPLVDSTHAHPLVLLDSQLKIHVYPSTPQNIELVNQNRRKIFFYVVDRENNTIEGYAIDSSVSRPALPLWNINFNAQNEAIQAVAVHPPNEAIGSPTLSNGDLSVRAKYINRNALAIATVSSVSYVSSATKKKAYESFVNVYLIDTVTGSIIHHSYHRNAQAPVSLVQSENWLVCHFWNWKLHRYEVSVVEFFEKQMNWDAKTFSSREIPQLEVLSQSYVFPTGVSTMSVTVTAKGITTKQVLLGLSSGRILGLDRRWLSARRPQKELLTEQDKATGVIPYHLKLPTPATSIINYYHTVNNVRGIQTAPAFLESTSLVFGYGLDLFFTRVTPSQTFDLLNDDFQYLPLVGTIVVLIVLTFVTGWLVSRKNLAKRWR